MSQQPATAAVPEWTLGWRLQRSLAHAGISVTDMAGKLGVSRGTLSRWMSDRGAPPRTIYLREWATLCDVDYEWLAGDSRRPRHRYAVIESGISPCSNSVYCTPRTALRLVA